MPQYKINKVNSVAYELSSEQLLVRLQQRPHLSQEHMLFTVS